MKSSLTTLVSDILPLISFVIGTVIFGVIVYGLVRDGSWLQIAIAWLVSITTLISILVLLPLCLFRKSRIVARNGFYISQFSYVFSLFCLAFLASSQQVGLGWTLLSCIFFLLGPIFLAIGSSVVTGTYEVLFTLIILIASIVITGGIRFLLDRKLA